MGVVRLLATRQPEQSLLLSELKPVSQRPWVSEAMRLGEENRVVDVARLQATK